MTCLITHFCECKNGRKQNKNKYNPRNEKDGPELHLNSATAKIITPVPFHSDKYTKKKVLKQIKLHNLALSMHA
jgi:hypothetical protein